MTWEHEGNCGPGCGHTDNPRNYCEHGTFVGDPYGPDYLCFWCESGISSDEYRAMQAAGERRQRRVAALAPRMRELLDYGMTLSGDQVHEPTMAALVARLTRMVRWGVLPAERPAATIHGAAGPSEPAGTSVWVDGAPQ